MSTKLALAQPHAGLTLLTHCLLTTLILVTFHPNTGIAQAENDSDQTNSDNQSSNGSDQNNFSGSRLSPEQSAAYAALPVPFGLQWGEGPEEITQWAQQNQFQTAWKENSQAQGTESLLEVTPPSGQTQFPHAEFCQLDFGFKNGYLVEIRLIFRYRDQNPTQSDSIAQSRLQLLEKANQNQAGQIVAQNRNDKNGVHYTTKTWQWEKGPGLYIWLQQADARQKDKSLTSLAISYRNQALADQLPNTTR